MANTLLVETVALRKVNDRYNELVATVANSSLQKPAGFDRSDAAAAEAAGMIGQGIAAWVSSLGGLATSVWDVAKHFQEVDASVQVDLDKLNR